MAKNKSGGILRGNMAIWITMGVILVIVFFVLLAFLRGIFQTETYYVLNDEQDTYPSRTEITAEMLEPMVIGEGSAPPNAMPLDFIQANYVYTRHPLNPGDILTESNAGPIGSIREGVPDEWVVTNFSVPADYAAGGRIHAGDYFDIMVASASGSYYPFINVLALDTTVDLSSASSAAAAESSEAYDGQTTQYVVAMSPENAAKLHTVIEQSEGEMRLVMSPRQNEYHAPIVDDYNDVYTYTPGEEIIWPGQGEDSQGNEVEVTDGNFREIDRNQAGEPVEQSESATGGNARDSEMIEIPQGQQDFPDQPEDSNNENQENAE